MGLETHPQSIDDYAYKFTEKPNMSGETCNIALIGTKFMGRAHSNAYLKVGKFFDLPTQPVMHTVCARNEAELKDFANT